MILREMLSFLVLIIVGEGPTYGMNGSFGSPVEKFNINFTKANTTFCFNLHYNDDNNYLLMSLMVLSQEKYP